MTSPTAKVYLNGHIDVPETHLAVVSEALSRHMELTRAEPGCLSFDVVPSQDHPGRFLVAEVFVDEAAFKAHQTRTRASEWFRVTDGSEQSYSIRKGTSDDPA